MKRKRYSVEQIVAAVKQHELGTSAADISRKLGIAEQTFYRWKKQYGGLEPAEVRELKQLRDENSKLISYSFLMIQLTSAVLMRFRFWLLTFLTSFLVAGCGGSDDGNTSIEISTTASEGGTISPTRIIMSSGETAEFIVTTENGFSLESVSGCDGTLVGDTYTIGTARANCAVKATFVTAIAESCYVQSLGIMSISTPNEEAITSKEEYIRDATLELNGLTLATSIRGRGNSTWLAPKKPYRLKLDQASTLLGMPASKNWALLANYYDTTSLRNHLAFCLSATLGLEYTSRSRFVELTLNGQYDGVYQLTEHREVAPGKVNIGDSTTPGFNGFFLERDWRYDQDAENIWFITSILLEPFVDKSDPELTPAQVNDANAFMDAVEIALTTEDYASFADKVDIDSMIDFYLINELLRNPEVFDTSTFLTRRHNDKLRFGPVWDFDLAAGVAVSYAEFGPIGFGVQNKGYMAQAFARFPEFEQQAQKRWKFMRQRLPLVLESLSYSADVIGTAKQRDLERWGRPLWQRPSFADEIKRLLDWLTLRIEWLDSEWVDAEPGMS